MDIRRARLNGLACGTRVTALNAQRKFNGRLHRGVVQLLLFGWASLPVTAVASSAPIVLENSALRIEVPLESGALLGGLRDVPLLSSDRTVRVRMPRGNFEGRWLSIDPATGFKVQSRGPGTLTLSGELRSQDTPHDRVPVRLNFELQGQGLNLTVELTNRSSAAIDQVEVPALGVPSRDEGESLELPEGPIKLHDLFSANTVRLRHDPFERLDPSDTRGWFYDDPGIQTKVFQYPSGFSLSTAWLHYSSAKAGVGLESMDRTFQTQYGLIEHKLTRDTESISMNSRSYVLAWRFVPEIRAGESWRSPPMRIHFDHGDWHETARSHREWLKSWLKRPDTPAAFKNSLGWMSRGIRSFDEIPTAAQQALDSGTAYLLVYGWFGSVANGGMNGLSYEYFPQQILGGEESLRKNLKKARELGAHPLAWYNGTTSSEIKLEHKNQGKDWLIFNRYGSASVDGRWSLYDPDRPPIPDDGAIYFNTNMGAGAGEFNVDNVRRMLQGYGFSGFEMDQAGKSYPAYSPQHAWHDPERHYSQGVIRLLEQARALLKQGDPSGIIVAEGSGDLLGQYIDSGWTFEGGSVYPPLDRYRRYSLPWLTTPAAIKTPDRAYVNQAFVMNAPLDLFLDPTAQPEFLRHLQLLHELKQQIAAYLYEGDFSDEEGFSLPAATESTLLAKSYLRGNSEIAVVIANLTDRSATANLSIAGADRPQWTIHRAAAAGAIPNTAKDLTLAPFEVIAVIAPLNSSSTLKSAP